MKFTIKKIDVLNVLSKIQGLTGRKSNIAITENVLIKTTDSGITMIATDLESGFEGFYPANIESKGIIAINAKKFFEIVRDFPSEEININEIENHWIEIGNKQVLYHIVGMNPDDFPEIPSIEEITLFKINSVDLKKMIDRTVIIIGGSDDNRAHVNGVYLESIKKEKSKLVRMVSTDGSRLSLVDTITNEDFFISPGNGIIIPKKGLTEVSKFLDMEGSVQIGLKDNNFIVKKDKETIIIRLLEGKFPNYDNIILKDDVNSIKINRQVFLMMLKRMSILSSETYKGAIFNYGKNNLMITVTNPDIGESKEDMAIVFDGFPIEASFNPKYFIETLNIIDDDSIIIHIKDEEKPCIIESENDKSYLSVIMPMRI